MSVLVIAPYRPVLPNVATEAAAVVNALGGRLVQGTVTEKDVRDAASEGGFDGIWFATHGTDNQLLLSDSSINEAAVVAYVAASGASWCFINTCQSINLGLRIVQETHADVICTIAASPDMEAMRTGVLFARQLSLLGDEREAYERSKPGDNRLYVYLENYRQQKMVAAGAGAYPAQDRLQATMDDMRRDVSKVASDVEVLKTRTGIMDARQARMEDRLDAIEHQLRPMPTWQTWVMLIVGFITCVGITMLLLRAGA